MDFDEYEYLEKTVEESEDRSGSSKKKESDEKRERGYRRREEEEDDEHDEAERRRKKSRGEDENGDKKRGDRERSERRREKDDRHRSDRDGEKDRDREKRDREKEKERRDREKREREKEKEKEREKERERRSSSRSRRHDSRDQEREKERELREREREREIGPRDGRRFKDKKEGEPEVDPERDQRTVFAYQMPLKATERDVYEFFSTAGKVRDVRLIMDRNSRRSKGVGYVEFYDSMSVPMAIAMSGQLLHGQPVMVKPSEAEKNLVQSTATAGGSNVTGPYGPTDRKLYVGNLHFNMTEQQLRQIFEPFGPVELVQLPLDLETGQCKGFGFVQFVQVEHAKAAQSLNGNLEIAGRVIKVSSVTEHVTSQEAGTTTADFDDDDGGGLSLNAQSRALLMQKLDRTGTASSMAGTLGVSMLNGSAPVQPGISMPFSGQAAFPAAALPGQVLTSLSTEIVGSPTECLLLKNLFDPTAENDPDFYLDVKEDVEVECSKFGPVKHVYLDRNAAQVYLRFDNKEAASSAQRAMHNRWFAQRLISAVFMEPQDYDAKFKDAA